MASLSATTAAKMADTVSGIQQVLAGQSDSDLVDAAQMAKELSSILNNYATRNPDRSTPGQIAAGHAADRSQNVEGTASLLNRVVR